MAKMNEAAIQAILCQMAGALEAELSAESGKINMTYVVNKLNQALEAAGCTVRCEPKVAASK